MSWLWMGGTGPHDLPHWAYSYLVVTLKADPNAVSLLKCLTLESFREGKAVTLVRVFDPAASRNSVREFASLDEHPELIRYEGYLDRQTGAVVIVPARTVPI